ncbi:MAG: sugar phosphate isomerase/epimerase [Spirochaetales bacterium]|nr:sugar phosphate isomerase/epimerase [Spirochaetales bacterium]
MKWPLVGVKMPRVRTLDALDAFLSKVQAQGFDAVEMSLEMFPFILDGQICKVWVDAVEAVLGRHPLLYSAHIGRGLDLRNIDDHELHASVLRSSLQVCHALHIDILVLHYEIKTNNLKAERQFLDAHRWAADLGGQLGITLAVENIEVELVEPVVGLMDQIKHPNLKLNLDTGHAYLAAKRFHFDFLDAVKQMAPHLCHMHLNDNTGRFEELRITDRLAYDCLSMSHRREFGRGDIHIPPFFGSVPFDEVFSSLQSYQGRFICEYTYEDFEPFNQAIQEKVRSHLLASRSQ